MRIRILAILVLTIGIPLVIGGCGNGGG